MRRASFHTLGCRLNQAETAVLETRLRKVGYKLVPFGEPTDLLVVNSCSVTEDAERSARYVIRKTLRHSPEAFVAITGCYAQTGVQELRNIPGLDLIVGNQFKWDLPDLLPAAEHLKKNLAANVAHTSLVERNDFEQPYFGDPNTTRPLLKIQDGCNVMCSFCLIPFARGRERSRIVENVLKEAEAVAALGHREVVLTGVNVGQYQQSGLDLAGLIDGLERIAGIERIRISSIEPTTVTEALLERMASSTKLCPYLHIPLQSGDNTILSAMNRPYDVKQYVGLIERALAAVPDIGLGTDIMVGFPGESEAAFERTYDLAQSLPFAYFHVFTYSARPGTAALKLPGPVSPVTAKARAQRMIDLCHGKRLAFAERHIGKTVQVLFESGETEGLRLGTTPNFLRVAVTAETAEQREALPVLIWGATNRWALGRVATALAIRKVVPV